MTDKESSSGSNISGLLGIVFVTLKLCGVIDWPWWWVTCPFWAGPAIVILGGSIAFVGLLFGWVLVLFLERDKKGCK